MASVIARHSEWSCTVSPHPQFEVMLERLKKCIPQPWAGIAVRATHPNWASAGELLSGVGAIKTAGRWNPPGMFRAVYMSDSPETALAESLARQRYYHLLPHDALPLTLVAVRISLHSIVSLRDKRVRRKLGLTVPEMIAEDWREMNTRGDEAITQTFGRAAFALGYEGLILPSAARRNGSNLLWFPDRLDKESRVTIERIDWL